MNMIKCYECRACNIKGKPSVMKGSAYCDDHIRGGVKHTQKEQRTGLFARFKGFLFDRRTRLDAEGNVREFKKKGFRESWFWR